MLADIHTREKFSRRLQTGLTLALCFCAVASVAGCYKRVVAARGFGADQYSVSEPYQENSKVDDWLFGERSQTRNNTKLKGLSSN